MISLIAISKETSFLSFDRNRKNVIMETAEGQGIPDERTGKKQKNGGFRFGRNMIQ
jgi:hypothetical protein